MFFDYQQGKDGFVAQEGESLKGNDLPAIGGEGNQIHGGKKHSLVRLTGGKEREGRQKEEFVWMSAIINGSA